MQCQTPSKRISKDNTQSSPNISSLAKKQTQLNKLIYSSQKGRLLNQDDEITIKQEADKKKEFRVTQRSKDKYGKSVFTSIQANNLVRENITKGGKKIIRIILSGNAILKHNHVKIRASRMIIDGGEIGALMGRVRVFDAKNKIKLYSNGARYNRKEQLLSLSQKPILQRRTKKGIFQITSENMQYYISKKVFELNKNVQVHYGDTNLLGDQGTFFVEQQKLILQKNPTIITKNMYLMAGHAEYASKKQSFVLRDKPTLYWNHNIQSGGGWKEKPNSKNERPQNASKGPTPSNLTILTAQNMRYSFLKKKKKYLEASGNVIATQPNMRMAANRLRFFGSKMENITASGDVHFIDQENKIEYRAQNMTLNNQTKKFTLYKNAWLYFYEEGQNAPSIISGGLIERDFQKRQILLQSNVQIQQKDYQAFAEIAQYYQNAGLMVLEGNPGLKKDNSFIRSEKIFIYQRKNRILFHNRIQGAL